MGFGVGFLGIIVGLGVGFLGIIMGFGVGFGAEGVGMRVYGRQRAVSKGFREFHTGSRSSGLKL